MSLTRDAGAQCPQRRRRPPQAHPGPLQALLEDAPHPAYCARAASSAQTTATHPTNERAPVDEQRHLSPLRWRWLLLADSNKPISARVPPSNEGTAAMNKGTAPAPLTAVRIRAVRASLRRQTKRLGLGSSVCRVRRKVESCSRTLTVKLRAGRPRQISVAGAHCSQAPAAPNRPRITDPRTIVRATASKNASVLSLRKAHKFSTIPSELRSTLDASDGMSSGSAGLG